MNGNKKAHVGSNFRTNEGHTLVVLEYVTAKNITVEFSDKLTEPFKVHIGNLRKGKVCNKMHKGVYGYGYVGVGEFSRLNSIKPYKSWSEMLRRCFGELQRKANERNTVEPDWCNFQVFCAWYTKQPNAFSSDCLELDKDIISLGNTHYSPENCRLVPREINTRYPKSNAEGCRTYETKRGLWQATQTNFEGVRKTFKDVSKETVELWKLTQVKELLEKLGDKYKDCLTEDTKNALLTWSNYYCGGKQ